MNDNAQHKSQPVPHELLLRIVHWLNVPLLALMLWSGLLIYWANDEYPGFFPERFYQTFNIGSRLAEGISIHFFIAWFLVINGVIYLAWLFLSGHWRELFPDRKMIPHILPTLLHDMGFRKQAPPQGKFNAMQRLAYTGVIGLAVLAVLSGFAIYKPVQLSWLTSLFGGYWNARLVHFVVLLAFCGFIVVHLVQVVRAGWLNFRAMVGSRNRSVAVLLILAACVFGGWSWLRSRPLIDDTPAPFRHAMNFNGRIWQSLFNPKKLNICKPPPDGQEPRFNGDIGIEEEVKDWKMVIIPDMAQPDAPALVVTMKDILALPKTVISTEFRCIEGWSEPMTFGGVKFSDFINFYHIEPKAYVGLATPDGEYYVSLDMASMLHEQTLLAYEMNGKPLKPENGAPLRLAIPIKYGIKSLKRIGQISFSDKRPPDYWHERGYDWYAGL